MSKPCLDVSVYLHVSIILKKIKKEMDTCPVRVHDYPTCVQDGHGGAGEVPVLPRLLINVVAKNRPLVHLFL